MINEDTIKQVASLARLELTQKEKKMYTEQISVVLEYMKMLDEVDTEDVIETTQVTGLENVCRDDVVVDSLAQRDDLLNAFSGQKDSHLTVQAVFNDA